MAMARRKKLLYNTIVSFLHQIITLGCGFILPRFFLQFYGSEINGLVSSITQFLGFISLAECGVGAVVQSTLYKPLAERDEVEISKIIVSAEHFFRKVALVLLGYSLILMVIYPVITLGSFNYFYTTSLIFVIAISTFAEYFFSITYKLLLNADQLSFIQLGIHAITLILNTIFSVILMENGAGIQTVKFMTSLLFFIQPLILTYYVKTHYKINRKLILTEEPIKQKWNGLAQHIAAVVLGNTDTVILTLFSSLANVSIYAVYNLVVNGVKQIVTSLTTGMASMFGDMYAKQETEKLNITFSTLEWMLHTITVFFFTCTSMLIVPFVAVYTYGIDDVNYIVPSFAVLITLAQSAYCLRLPYNMMVLAAGHYKETQWSAIIEVLINVIISVALVVNFGLAGVAIGTLVAMLYRTFYLAWYLSQNILNRPFKFFLKHMIVDCFCMLLTYVLSGEISMNSISYFSWIIMAFKVGLICMFIVVLVNGVCYKKEVLACVRLVSKKLMKIN